jgi:FKBP-type peptidyl-prolyl cis-trans isomerase FklB
MKKYILYLFAMTIGLVGLSSCSEEASEEEEYANWKERNEQFLASLVNDSLKQQNWQRIKLFSLDPTTEGAASDYIYVKKISYGNGTETPIYTDSVRVVYQGRIIPSKSYPKGFVFDGTVFGEYSVKTAYTTRQLVSNTILGYATALQNMHKGDYWRVYIPSELGYGTSGYSTIPGYSVLVFDLTLLDFSPVGETMKPWR